ncbi:hypothetical protein CONCODRAFT_10294 [Conidiobolus coronatus NRRL 28638]|uniref:G-protein coupled receptors family 1 profile domain-containing protein n=1 Tax=Conidiobolus coronatus (strain ATCC 28846 / CBS 209.66 / NRRL 28638) TaxID=796925 RepID=A0A137NXM0_CONC2|nr:hypothetical protein CONCODRAFT_10294 [Conidiobolus coronatus NRRL 28638]|eukprot:KXN67603.1 hypothetical protein CONCODRAFT_10294 [Conidiobolus coronatus NRRL 28638]
MLEENISIYHSKPYLSEYLKYLNLIFGLIGLSLTLVILISIRQILRKSIGSHLLICFGILIVDITLSLGNIILGLAGLVDDKYIVYNQWFCGFVDLVFVGGGYVSIWYVGLLSLERGLLIIHGISLPSALWLFMLIVELGLFLSINLIAISENQVGLANLGTYCFATFDFYLGSIATYIYYTLMVLSIIITIYSYIGIAVIQRKRAWQDIENLHLNKDETLHSANKIIFKVLALLILYLGANLLEAVIQTIEITTGEVRSSELDFTSILLTNCNPIVNSIVLVQFHEPVKLALLVKYPILANFISNKALNTNEQVN